jgi:hypothetical protein
LVIGVDGEQIEHLIHPDHGTRPLALVVPPFAGDQARVAQPAEQRVDGAIAGQQAIGGGEVADEFQPEARPELKQRQDARSEHAPSQLGQAALSRHA